MKIHKNYNGRMGERPGHVDPLIDTSAQFRKLTPTEETSEADSAVLDFELDLPEAISDLHDDPDQSLSTPDRALMVADAVGWYFSAKGHQYDKRGIKRYDRDARLLTDREGFGRFLSTQLGHTGVTLETAAGTGLVSQQLVPNASKLVLTDNSEAALEILQERMGDRAKIAKADFLELPFRNKSFDTLVCVGGYRYVPKDAKGQFMEEAKRVLKKNGRLVIGQFRPRGVPINGRDLTREEATQIEGFNLRSLRHYDSRIKLPRFSVRSGRYDILELVTR